MHHGTCVTHVPWCMSGSLTRGGGENVPGISGAYATRNFTYLARDAWGASGTKNPTAKPSSFVGRCPMGMYFTHYSKPLSKPFLARPSGKKSQYGKKSCKIKSITTVIDDSNRQRNKIELGPAPRKRKHSFILLIYVLWIKCRVTLEQNHLKSQSRLTKTH